MEPYVIKFNKFILEKKMIASLICPSIQNRRIDLCKDIISYSVSKKKAEAI